ncbi:hypothetical protein QTO34_000353 [Cnephaeus nilssonii]|uniref:Uncharacterized protein n=1 Tax=Cnephaeus nilssonii TaxID=3371016 RepID=A0AA40ICC0_CNENI|nr:hypothetical protein QTO34_000353 [Eptesicus nilssonii]
MTADSLPGLSPLTGLPSLALTAEELKYTDIHNIGWESEWMELMNAELKIQMEELKQEQQQLILMLNRHYPSCFIRTHSVKTPNSEGNPLMEQLEKK